MLQAIIIDKEPLFKEIIEKGCIDSQRFQLKKLFTTINEGLKYLHKSPVDLLFIDIEMAKSSGVDFRLLSELNTMVIFVSETKDLAVDAYNMNAIDFLLKPYSEDRLSVALNKAILNYNIKLNSNNAEEKPNMFLRADYGLRKFILSDILYIESLGDYINIYLQNQKRITTRLTMKMMLSKLNTNEFIRVHRKYIIPLNRIENVKSRIISIAGREIPIGNKYRKDAMRHLAN